MAINDNNNTIVAPPDRNFTQVLEEVGYTLQVRVDEEGVLVSPTAEEITTANPGLGSGAVALSDIYVATDGNDAAAGTVNAPLLTPAAAVAAAIAETPSATNPIVIHVGRGVFLETANITVPGANPYITMIGEGYDATIIQFSSSFKLTISARNKLRQLSVERSGSNTGAVVTCVGSDTPMTFATYVDGVEWESVRISNSNVNGTAVDVCTANTRNCVIEATSAGGTGIEQIYGGEHSNLRVTAGKYAVRYAQSAVAGSIQSYPEASTRPVIFHGSRLVQTDATGGHVIQGLVESSTMNQVTTAGITWFATWVDGGLLRSACADNGDTAATSETIRGCLHLESVKIEGDRWSTNFFDSYANACYWSAQHVGATLVLGTAIASVCITGGNMIVGLGGVKVLTFESTCVLTGVIFEQDPTTLIGYDQWLLTGCSDVTSKQAIGFTRKDLSALVDHVNYVIETATGITTYNLATATFEAWVKLKSTSTNGAIMALPSSTEAGFLIAIERSANRIYGGFNPSGSAYLDSSACSDLFASNTTSGPYSDGWHHVAMTLSGGTQRLWLDGVEKDDATGATPAPTSGRFLIGGYNSNDNAGAPFDAGFFLDGMITGVRISNVVRYTTGTVYTTATLKKHWEPDADTVGLWSDTTTGPKIWEDKMGNHNANLQTNFPAPWVRQAYTPI